MQCCTFVTVSYQMDSLIQTAYIMTKKAIPYMPRFHNGEKSLNTHSKKPTY